jgi:hypothetical protein
VKQQDDDLPEPSAAEFRVDDYRKPAAKKISSVASYGVGLFFVLIAWFLFLGLTRQVSCQDIVVREVPSNDGTLKVSLFKRECIGEPTAAGVSVMERTKFGVQGPGNLLQIAGSDLEDISVRWERPRTLVIGHPAGLRLRTRSIMTQFGFVSVREE